MKKITFLTSLLLLSLTIGSLAAQVKMDSLSNKELRRMFEADQAERMGGIPDWRELVRKDSLRRERVRIFLDSGQVRTPAYYYHAAMVFQHGTDTLDSGMAVKLMTKAVALDTTMNKWLLAAANSGTVSPSARSPLDAGPDKGRHWPSCWRSTRKRCHPR